MEIKSSINGHVKPTKYPWVGISDYGVVVIFQSLGTGVALNKKNGWKIGESSINFDEKNFSPFYGEIKIIVEK